jgi:hypothetical protein
MLFVCLCVCLLFGIVVVTCPFFADDSLTLNSQTRALLMAKLQRGNAPTNSLPIIDQIQQSGVVIQASRCVVLQHCFDAAREDATPDNDGWEQVGNCMFVFLCFCIMYCFKRFP